MGSNPAKRRKIEQNDAAIPSEDESMHKSSSEGEESFQSSDAEEGEIKKGNCKRRRSRSNKNGKMATDRQLADIFEYKSNVFRMETDELLSEVWIDHRRRMMSVEKVLHKLRDIIQSLPEKRPMPLSDAERLMFRDHKIVIPFPSPRPNSDAKYKFAYQKPSYINVIGSFALKTMVKQSSTISADLMLIMPPSLFQEKDYLNYRYFYKRAYYLACIAAGIQSAEGFNGKLTFTLLNGDPLRPILVVSPSGDGGEFDFSKSKCNIQIIPSILQGTFSQKKLAPFKNCVRTQNQGEGHEVLPPVPTYNSSILADTAYLSHLRLLHSSASQCAAFREAAILGRVWLRQRGFTSDLADGGFGNFEWSILMALLLKGGGTEGRSVLAAGFNCYQLFKATLQWVATRDLVTDPMAANGDKSIPVYGPDLPVVFDEEYGLNILFKMTPWSYRLLRHEANLTLKALNGSVVDQFTGVFLDRVDEPILHYDLIARVSLPAACGTSVDFTLPTENRLSFTRRLYSSLIHGLTDRITLLYFKLPSTEAWSVKKLCNEWTAKSIILGFVLDGDKYNRVMDHGPAAEDKTAGTAFQKFWGEKAELRRFKDGRILETVYWEDKNNNAPVFEQIVTYIIGQHMGAHVADTFSFIGNEYGGLLSKHQNQCTQATTKLFHSGMNGYHTLVKDLRAIDLPLHIRNISPASPALRYCSIQCPLSSTSWGELMEPADVDLQFETSSRWPDDLVAIQKTKVALLLKVAKLLHESSNGEIFSRIGIENEKQTISNNSFLDVIYMSGPAFRIRVHLEREVFLLERRITNRNVSPCQREEACQALTLHKRLFIKAPLHTQSIQKLCHRYPLLSSTTRLVKKWFSSHLLKSHFTDEFIELLVTRCFVSSFPWTSPSSLSSGFVRILEFLSTWDWRKEPLVVDVSEEGTLSSADLEDIQSKFESVRKSDPGLNRIVLFAASNHDHEGITWTQNGPSRVVASRMTMLAKAAVDLVKSHDIFSCPPRISIKSLFQTPLSDYSFVIHLSKSPLFLPKSLNSSLPREQQFKNLNHMARSPLALKNLEKLSFHPIELFLSELRHIYRDSIVFFYGGEEASTSGNGNVIGGLWSPSAAQGRGWKVNLSYSTAPSRDSKAVSVTINKTAIINEIARLGGDMIEKIEVNESMVK